MDSTRPGRSFAIRRTNSMPISERHAQIGATIRQKRVCDAALRQSDGCPLRFSSADQPWLATAKLSTI
jgi:hypothetical protein